MRSVRLTLFLLLVSLANSAFSQDSLNVRKVGQYNWWDFALAVVVQDTLVYVAAGEAGLRIVNVADPTAPDEVGFCNRPELAIDVAVEGDYAYIADLGGCLRVIDVSNPFSPMEVVTYDPPGESINAVSVAVEGDYVYVVFAYGEEGTLHIIDITIPSAPNPVGFYDSITGSIWFDLKVRGDFAYLTEPYWLEIVNIQDRTSPFQESITNPPIGGMPCGVALSENYAFLSHCSIGGGGQYNLSIVDIRDPGDPEVVGTCVIGGQGLRVAVTRSCALVAANYNGLRVVDVSNLTNPVEVFGGSGYTTHSRDVAVSGNFAYVADGANGLVVLDITECTSPVLTGYFNTRGDAVAVSVAGNYAYIAKESSGLRVVDVSNPLSPYEVAFFESTQIGSARDVALLGNHVYVAYGGLWALDITNPEAPDPVGFCSGFTADGIAVSEDYYAYIVGGSRLRAINVSNPADPVEMDNCTAGNNLRRVAVHDNYAYAVGITGMRVIDISNPNDLDAAGSYDVSWANDVAVRNNCAYVAGLDGLHIIDVTDPDNPTELAQCDLPWTPLGVVVQGDYAYVADSDSGLYVIDVTDCENPVVVGFYDTPGDAYDVAVSGIYAYVADGDRLGIYDISDAVEVSLHHDIIIPSTFMLYSAYPNPFNPTTTIRYDVKQAGQVRLTVFNLLGQEVARLADGRHLAGSYSVSWDATSVPSGIYLCQMQAPGFMQTRKLVLLK